MHQGYETNLKRIRHDSDTNLPRITHLTRRYDTHNIQIGKENLCIRVELTFTLVDHNMMHDVDVINARCRSNDVVLLVVWKLKIHADVSCRLRWHGRFRYVDIDAERT